MHEFNKKNGIAYFFSRAWNWMFPFSNEDVKQIKEMFYKQAWSSMQILFITLIIISIFILIISFASNIHIFSLIKSLTVLWILFLAIFVISYIMKNDKINYYLLIFSIISIATWGIFKDIINFDVIFNRYGIIYVILLFFGLIFMPFPPIIPMFLALYCAILFSVLWLLFIYQIYGHEWIIELNNNVKFVWLDRFTDNIRKKGLYLPHWKYHSSWYFFQYLILGTMSTIFRAANIQNYIKTFRANKKLVDTESDLNITKLLLAGEENQHVEFKAAARWDYMRKKVNKDIEIVILKSIAGFLNSEGGTLLIGVDDKGEAIGLENDYNTLKKKNSDGYELFLINLISDYLGRDICSNIGFAFIKVRDKKICAISVSPAQKPVFIEKLDQVFYVRTGNSTQKLNTKEALDFIKKRFK